MKWVGLLCVLVCVFSVVSVRGDCGEHNNCLICLEYASTDGCGWCADTGTCTQGKGQCQFYSEENCLAECGKYDHDCEKCLGTFNDNGCGWCHGLSPTGDSSAKKTSACINTQSGTSPNEAFECVDFILPKPVGSGECPNCQKVTDCLQCTGMDYCGVCTVNKDPSSWLCQEGDDVASFGMCFSEGENPSDSWSFKNCKTQCPLFATCASCAKAADHCEWCESDNAEVGTCVGKGETATCAKIINQPKQCPGETSTECGDRKDCAECVSGGTIFECGWCETPELFKCMNKTEKDQCPSSDDWYDEQKMCPKHCPGYPDIACSGNGICDPNTKKCTCNTNYFGKNCDQYCTKVENCNNRGTCTLNEKIDLVECQCETNWYGDACAIECIDDKTCNSKGVCGKNGICECFEGYAGNDCHELTCADLDRCVKCVDGNKIENGTIRCNWCEMENLCLEMINDTCPSESLKGSEQCFAESCNALHIDNCIDGNHCECFWCHDSQLCMNTEGKPPEMWPDFCPTYSYGCEYHTSSGGSDGLSGGIIALIVILCLCIVGVVAGALFWIFFLSQRMGYSSINEKEPLRIEGEGTFHSEL